jgi:diguanylate cyclase (GGDEF)-like protein
VYIDRGPITTDETEHNSVRSPGKSNLKILWILSLIILLIDGIFVASNIYFTQKTLDEALTNEAEELHSSFEMLLDETYGNMLAMATFIANDSALQDLFLKGKKAVEAEGGGPGGPQAAAFRQQLLEKVGPNWQKVQADFKVRQLHFHLGPGSTSFLRVHRPDKFGDVMDDVRFTIVDTNAQKTPRSGFETGRVYSGLRGVVPFFAFDPDSGHQINIGALEVGTSFSNILSVLDQRLHQGIGVLLTMDHIRSTMWPDFVSQRFGRGITTCDCVIESTSRDGLAEILAADLFKNSRLIDPQTQIITVDRVPYVVSLFPLRDYRGSVDRTRPAVGQVVFWRDASSQIAAFDRSILFNVLYGLFGFLFVEMLIYIGFRFATMTLEQKVREQTSELEKKAGALHRLSITDRLTGLFNRLKLDQSFKDEVERHRRYQQPFSIIMFDVDHFKNVNDTYGHQVGDQVLVDLAEILLCNVRRVDIPGRWGGEEFLILCPNTSRAGAAALAEKLRTQISSHDFPIVGHKTTSFGVAELTDQDDISSLTKRADEALYRAKATGRNRVEEG